MVALLADGLRYREVAACLSISVRQVQRHVANAVTRTGLRNANELVTVAVFEGLVPGPAGAARDIPLADHHVDAVPELRSPPSGGSAH